VPRSVHRQIARMAHKQRDDTRGIARLGRDFSHSERAELFPEVPISNMGPLARIRVLEFWMLVAVLLLAGSSP